MPSCLLVIALCAKNAMENAFSFQAAWKRNFQRGECFSVLFFRNRLLTARFLQRHNLFIKAYRGAAALDQGEFHADERAAVRRVSCNDTSAMILHQRPDNGKPQARSTLFA